MALTRLATSKGAVAAEPASIKLEGSYGVAVRCCCGFFLHTLLTGVGVGCKPLHAVFLCIVFAEELFDDLHSLLVDLEENCVRNKRGKKQASTADLLVGVCL